MDFINYRSRSRYYCSLLVLLACVIGAPLFLAQDVQMVPDKQDRESAAKAQSNEANDQEPAETLKVVPVSHSAHTPPIDSATTFNRTRSTSRSEWNAR